jgi:hypothetical protein
VLAGETCWDSGGEQTPFRQGEVLRCPTVARSETTWSGLSVALIGIPLAAVEQAAHGYDGTDPADGRARRPAQKPGNTARRSFRSTPRASRSTGCCASRRPARSRTNASAGSRRDASPSAASGPAGATDTPSVPTAS